MPRRKSTKRAKPSEPAREGERRGTGPNTWVAYDKGDGYKWYTKQSLIKYKQRLKRHECEECKLADSMNRGREGRYDVSARVVCGKCTDKASSSAPGTAAGATPDPSFPHLGAVASPEELSLIKSNIRKLARESALVNLEAFVHEAVPGDDNDVGADPEMQAAVESYVRSDRFGNKADSSANTCAKGKRRRINSIHSKIRRIQQPLAELREELTQMEAHRSEFDVADVQELQKEIQEVKQECTDQLNQLLAELKQQKIQAAIDDDDLKLRSALDDSVAVQESLDRL